VDVGAALEVELVEEDLTADDEAADDDEDFAEELSAAEEEEEEDELELELELELSEAEDNRAPQTVEPVTPVFRMFFR